MTIQKRQSELSSEKVFIGVDLATPGARDKSVTMTITAPKRKITARERIENMRIDKEFDDLDVLGGFNENA